MPNDAQNFWDFSVDLYARPGVASACLDLQELYRLDVNLILFCFWHGHAYGRADRELMESVVAFSSQWRAQIVQPLRNARTWMKLNAHPNKQFDSLRERIKADELIAEKIQQEQIDSLTSEFNRHRENRIGADDLQKNIESLLQEVEMESDERFKNRIELIRGALEN